MNRKRSAIFVICGLLLAILATACGNAPTGQMPNGTMTSTNRQQASQGTPMSTTVSTGNNQTNQGNNAQTTPDPAMNGDQNMNNDGQDGTPPATNDTMLIGVRNVMINGASVNVLTTGDGMTLYYRTSDPAPDSGCSGACAATWPPLLNNNMTIVTSQSLPKQLTVQQTANGMQVEYDGHPLYTYVGDKAAGQVNGEGSGGVWHSVQIQTKTKHW